MAVKMNMGKRLTDEEIIENRLRHFINKYYRVKVFQGLAITVSAALLIFLFLMVTGNLMKPGSVMRTVVLAGGWTVLGGVFIYYVLVPVAQRFGILNGLNLKEASSIIQQKHKSIEDRIINIIELAREKTGKNNQLYDYAIGQKADNIKDFNFEDAISFRKLGSFLLRLSVLAVMVMATIVLWPSFIKRGIGQIWLDGKEMALINSVEYKILNDSLMVESGKDFLLRFSIITDLPVEQASVKIGGQSENAVKNNGSYEYTFRAVNSAISFQLACNDVISGEYTLKMLKKPEISGLQLKLIPPSYTGLESTVMDNDGNAEVPAGSTVIWSVRTVNTDQLIFNNGTENSEIKKNKNMWNFDRIISNELNYGLNCKNDNGLFTDYFYKISIVKDLFPTIDISDSRDSTVSNDVYVQGVIQDDYGFSKLEIVESRLGAESVKEVKIKASGIYEEFYYTLVPDSNNTVYYFRVWDNDRVTGPKFTESRKITLRTISKEEIANLNTQLGDSIKHNMSDGMNAIDKMERKISEFKMEQVLGDLKPWEIQEKMKELNMLKEQVVDFLNNVSKTNKEFTDNEKLLNINQELTEKAKQIQELMAGLMDDEMKELLKQFEDLAKEFNARKAEDITGKMEMNLEKLKEQMEMSLELFKKYEMEKDLIKQVDKLNNMADSLQSDKKNSQDSVGALKKDFKKWEEEYEKNLQQDQQLKKPMGLEKLEKEREEVRKDAEDLEKSESDEIKPGGKQSGSKAKAASSLKKLAKKMSDMLGMKEGEGQFVDLEDLRQIRNSLNDFSMKQEDLNNRIERVNAISPTFTAVIREQKELEDKFVGIRDSLKSIGYKQPIITKIIGTELFHVETSMKNLFENSTGNRASIVRVEQNRIMSEVNSIAVKLDELIKSMQDAKGTGKGDKGFTDRKKPKEGDSKGSDKMGEAKSKQESLKEQLKSAIKKMQSGANGKKERSDLAKMLGEREMMRKALEKVLQDGGLGTEAREKANQALNMMKEVEKDIIYNRLGDPTLQKDDLIKTRLLEAENAEKERENENRRESKEFKGSFQPIRDEPDKAKLQNKAQEQLLKYNELKLKRFYQDKYQKYIESTKK